MINVRVAFGTMVHELKDVSKSYKEAKMASDVGKIFYQEKQIISYPTRSRLSSIRFWKKLFLSNRSL